MEHKHFLLQSLEAGYIDQSIHSNGEYLPELVINDRLAGKKVLSTIQQELLTCDEFWFSVAFVTTSGVATLINTLVELNEKGVKGKILVSQYLNFSQPEALRRLLQFKNIELKIIVEGNFHSKGYLFKNEKVHDLIIGSSNLTASALCVNKEWNLKISATGDSYIMFQALKAFTTEFENAVSVDQDYIDSYEKTYLKQLNLYRQNQEQLDEAIGLVVKPNAMQIDALANIERLRTLGKAKALLISATGTGKTYLSAFDVLKYKPKKFLFVVHRLNIAAAAMKTFKAVFGKSKSMGLYSGNTKEINEDFLFSTIQTISKEKNMQVFEPEEFDYIVIDETHRAGADSYQKILDYFKPKFLLGMTATPERTDGLDIFSLFDHNIAYEIRLRSAMEEGMVSPFHYYGVTDISVNGVIVDDNADFNRLVADERVERILEKAKVFGTDCGIVRGLIFCSNVAECTELSKKINNRGLRTIALTGINSDEERAKAICRIESTDEKEKIDYILTVDIFNEGVDIPSVNQIIMLRPTQSAIIFVQQLGRGLRKTENKEYLTVIDFIGNYSNNYLVPIALYGDTSFNKDSLRRLMSSGSTLIPVNVADIFDSL
jgi:superfamily II DNA or RNA helicase/HKD family nuclease